MVFEGLRSKDDKALEQRGNVVLLASAEAFKRYIDDMYKNRGRQLADTQVAVAIVPGEKRLGIVIREDGSHKILYDSYLYVMNARSAGFSRRDNPVDVELMVHEYGGDHYRRERVSNVPLKGMIITDIRNGTKVTPSMDFNEGEQLVYYIRLKDNNGIVKVDKYGSRLSTATAPDWTPVSGRILKVSGRILKYYSDSVNNIILNMSAMFDQGIEINGKKYDVEYVIVVHGKYTEEEEKIMNFLRYGDSWYTNPPHTTLN